MQKYAGRDILEVSYELEQFAPNLLNLTVSMVDLTAGDGSSVDMTNRKFSIFTNGDHIEGIIVSEAESDVRIGAISTFPGERTRQEVEGVVYYVENRLDMIFYSRYQLQGGDFDTAELWVTFYDGDVQLEFYGGFKDDPENPDYCVCEYEMYVEKEEGG